MTNLIYAELDIFGTLILLIFYINQRRAASHAMENRLFNWVLLVTMFVLVLDGALWTLDRVSYPGSRAVLFGLTSLSYIVNPMIALIWIFYCDLRTHSDERRLRSRAVLYLFPWVLEVLFVIVNLFTPLMFTIDETSHYHRDGFFLLYMAVYYVYLIWASIIILHKIRHCATSAERNDLRFLLWFSIPPFFGGTLQGLFYGTSFSWPCTVISIVIVYINVLNRQIFTDSLTGLNNRQMLRRYLNLKITSADADTTLYVIMLDADNFKNINDSYTHSVGDRALTQIAGILKNLCNRRDCFLARLGGDEFVIVGEDTTGRVPEEMVWEIESRIRVFNKAGTEPYRLGVSAGIARYDAGGVSSLDAFLVAADRSMYATKAAKKLAQEELKESL